MPAPAEAIVLPTRGWPVPRRTALIAGALAWAGFAIIAGLVHAGHAEAIDRAGFALVRGDQPTIVSPGLIEGVRDVTSLGGTPLRVLAVSAAVVALLFVRLRREALVLVASVVTGAYANDAVKQLFGRARPEIAPHLTEASGESFPSGHSFNAAMVYIAIALAFAAFSARGAVRATIVAAALALSLLVAWTRVWLGVHFPTDVIAGWCAGAGWAFVAAALFERPGEAALEALDADVEGGDEAPRESSARLD